MKPFVLHRETKQLLGDMVTPVSLFMRVRDDSSPTLLLESGDYRGAENSLSFVCSGEIASYKVDQEQIEERYPDGSVVVTPIEHRTQVLGRLQLFRSRFETAPPPEESVSLSASLSAQQPSTKDGLFGYLSYDAIRYFETFNLTQPSDPRSAIPRVRYSLFSHVVSINHFHNRMQVSRLTAEGCELSTGPYTSLEQFLSVLLEKRLSLTSFSCVGEEESNFSDDEYYDVVTKCQEHIQLGDIFQIVPSRRFSQKFQGDDFNVYRALRSINPSPYLFFFDYGAYRLFGSSPEAELVVDEQGKASVFPIAGTLPRGTSEEEDNTHASALQNDPKENAEHVMLVDLARNDLSKHCDKVRVEKFKEVQFYSHVIHLVSKVSGTLRNPDELLAVLADTFPAGTLSGAPKYRAMELIDRYERGAREFYGGCIGYLGFNNECNHAIMIRSFLSKAQVLYSQSGGGVVAYSKPENEVEEVKNKLRALKRAILEAERVGI